MKEKNIVKESVNTQELNQVLHLSSRILKILYIVIIIAIVLFGTILLKEWKIYTIILNVLIVISPVFIGLVAAWLLNPLVSYFQKKGMNRIMATIIVFVALILIVVLFFWSIIPILFEQINELSNMIPKIVTDANWTLNNIFDDLANIEGLDITEIRDGVFNSISEYGKTLMVSVPESFVKMVSGLFSGIGQIVLGLLVGFYLLLNFDGANKHLFSLIPKKYQKESKLLIEVVDSKLHRFVKGTLLSSSILFLLNLIGFSLIGLKAPILFALFCGITNIIPYIGPYIGSVPAIIVGFSQGSAIGVLVLIVITITQLLEGNILHPLIMSKSMKLHPVTIIVSLLIFGNLFGIIGMVIATPVVSLLKIFAKFIFKKLKLFDMEDYDLASELE